MKRKKSLFFSIFISVFILIPALIVGGDDRARDELESLGIPFSVDSFLEKAQAGDLDAVSLFLRAGIDVDGRDEKGITALMLASFEGHIDIARLLIKRGADVSAQDQFAYSPLMGASLHGHTEVAAFLLKNGALVNARNEKGITPPSCGRQWKGIPIR